MLSLQQLNRRNIGQLFQSFQQDRKHPIRIDRSSHEFIHTIPETEHSAWRHVTPVTALVAADILSRLDSMLVEMSKNSRRCYDLPVRKQGMFSLIGVRQGGCNVQLINCGGTNPSIK